MKKLLFSLLAISLSFTFPREPMQPDVKESAAYRWLNKKVIESKSLDDMENLATWNSFTTSGGEVVDARKVIKIKDSTGTAAAINLSKDRVHNGVTSLRMTTPTRLAGVAPKSGRGWGRSGVRRQFDNADWTSYNRISLWIYPDLPGFYTTAIDFRLHNNGVEKLPALFAQEGETSLILRNQEWNHVVWEIGNVARDKITGFEMSYGLSGNTPEEADNIAFYFDQLDLEKVEGDKIEGWDVWPGRISYSHTGYQTGAAKSAIANNINAKEFRVIDQATGEVAVTKPIVLTNSPIGSFQVMDFSEIRKPGTYVLEAGAASTLPFHIEADVYEQTIWKALNFFYMERCGADIPGVHSACHRDWSCTHGDKRIMINGGWHDAGDLTQGIENSGDIAYGLFALAEKLKVRNEHEALRERVLEEAKWGLDWIMKTRFGDGWRNGGSINSRRTNNILGDFDDITVTARNSPMTNFQAAAVEAIAYRVLKESDPRLANLALKLAISDWQFAVDELPAVKPSPDIWRGTFDSNNVEHEIPAQGVLTSIDLFKATGDSKFADKAVEMAKVIMRAQQRKRTDWDIPMSGFYYTNSAKDRILHYCHRGREQGATLALAELCNALPDHTDWMKWYSGVALYSEYLKTISTYTAPYSVMPASVYKDDEYVTVPESRKESYRKQVLQGVPLGKGYYLRMFPVWMDYRGHFGTILPQAQAMATAAHLRGDLSSMQLAERQLEWIVGRNPFSQSMMYGEGHDFPPLYTPSSGDMVGGLPVGIQSRGEADVPYWPVQNTWTYKEIWVHPVSRWVWLLKDAAGAAIVEGKADGAVEFKEISTGEVVKTEPSSTSRRFRIHLPEGEYKVTSKGITMTQVFLPGTMYDIDLRPSTAVTFSVEKTSSSKNQVTIQVSAKGNGLHRFAIRTDNLSLTNPVKEINLNGSGAITWKATIADKDAPWVAVVIVDGDMAMRKEIRGE